MTKRRTTMERTFAATLEEVWELWTTKDGIESWWGPEGFGVKVRSIDLRPGGKLEYSMFPTAPDQIAFMEESGMPMTVELQNTYTVVEPLRKLAYESIADFVPGVEPYPVSTVVEFQSNPQGVRMVLTFDAMHDDIWTQRAVMGNESQLRKLAKVIES